MRGLIEKDLRLTLARKQTLVLFIGMALIMGIAMEGSFIVGYLTMLAVIVAVGTISYDELDNGFAFLMTLPFDRKTYVKEKYLFCLFMAAAGWCLGAVMLVLANIVRGEAASPMAELPMLLALIPVMFLTAAVIIPLQLKYGSEKSRIVLFVIFGVIAVLIFGANRLAGSGGDRLAGLAGTLENMSPVVILLAVTAVCALAAGVSLVLSIRIVEKKEF